MRLRVALLSTILGFFFVNPGHAGNPWTRVPNSTLALPVQPPALEYTVVDAFNGLSFSSPVALRSAPGETGRIFVVEQDGRISVITNLAVPTRHVFLDLTSQVTSGGEAGLLGLAFHPGYATNRYFYVFYSLFDDLGDFSQRLARFETDPADPNQADRDSEQPLLTMRDDAGNHNGGDLHFGPDGYLYVALGDEGGGDDQLGNSQRIDLDFWAGILRLDVDNLPENPAPHPHPAIHEGTYRVPADNPFIGLTEWQGLTLDPETVRTEFYAVGLRNPWRFSFDPGTGLLYCGDVGQDAREEIDIIVKGGNYGWGFREGTIPGPKAEPPGTLAIEPILDYPRADGGCVIGGVVYRGSRISSLFGHYIFADFSSGNIWATAYAGSVPSPFFRLAVSPMITAFGVDPSNGDVLLCDANEHKIKRLIARAASGVPIPETLAETGVFTDTAALIPAPGFVAYDVNLPFWSDRATKSRWFHVPYDETITFRPTNNWTFPSGSVWVKHFELELTNGVPESRKRLETRLLVRDDTAGVYGLTYRWGDSLTNATLVPEEGWDEDIVIDDGGIPRTQSWHYPSRSECLRCHTGAAVGGLALGFNTPQLNRDIAYDTGRNQIETLHEAGYFAPETPRPIINRLRALARPDQAEISLEQRARSYLAANCSFCHTPGGPGGGTFDARIFTPLSQTGLIDGWLHNNESDEQNRVIVPGVPEHSMLLSRLSRLGSGLMPPLGHGLVDVRAEALVMAWITSELDSYRPFERWQAEHFASIEWPEAWGMSDPDEDKAPNYQEYLAGTDPNSAASFWPLTIEQTDGSIVISYERVPNRGIELQWTTDLAQADWQFLDQPDNRPTFARTGVVARVVVAATNETTRFFRARIYEP